MRGLKWGGGRVGILVRLFVGLVTCGTLLLGVTGCGDKREMASGPVGYWVQQGVDYEDEGGVSLTLEDGGRAIHTLRWPDGVETPEECMWTIQGDRIAIHYEPLTEEQQTFLETVEKVPGFSDLPGRVDVLYFQLVGDTLVPIDDPEGITYERQ